MGYKICTKCRQYTYDGGSSAEYGGGSSAEYGGGSSAEYGGGSSAELIVLSVLLIAVCILAYVCNS